MTAVPPAAGAAPDFSGPAETPGRRLEVGLTATVDHRVGDGDTAAAVGSGDLAVLGTPRLLAWMEGATCTALTDVLGEGRTSVGTRVSMEHVRASPVGSPVSVAAELVHVDGRLVRFQVQAAHADGVVVAHGEITRVLVDAARFLSRL
jgi:predicted thioesterase